MRPALLRSYTALSLAGALATMGRAGAARPVMTLDQAQQLALKNHPLIQQAAFDVAAAEEAVSIAKSAYAPQVIGDATSALAPPGTRIAAYPGVNNPTVIQRTAAGVAITQYITDFGHTAALVDSYEYQQKAQAEEGVLTRDTVLLNVTQAYFEVLRARALLAVALQTQRTRATLLHQVSVLQRAGLRSTLDVSIALRDKSAADQLVLEARARRADAHANFYEALGMQQEANYYLKDVRSLPVFAASIAPLLDEMLKNNPQLRALQATLAAAQKRAVAVAKETSPSIAAYGYAGGVPIRAVNQAINQAYATAGIAMTVPIVNGGALRAASRQAQDVADAQQAVLEDRRESLLRDTRVAFDDVQAAHGNIDATEQIVRTAQQAYLLTAARYRIGLNSIVDLSQAQLNETQAEIDHTNAIYDYIERGVGLQFVTGILSPA